MRRTLKRLALLGATTLSLAALMLALPVVMAPGAGAATCTSNTLNVNLGSGCASVAGIQLVGSSTHPNSEACADGADCVKVDPGTAAAPEPILTRTPPASAPRHAPPRAAPEPAVRIAPAQHIFRINQVDAESNAWFYSGDYDRLLPYSADRPPALTAPVPRPSFARGWHLPSLPAEALLSLFIGLMLLASAGGVRRMMASM